MSSTKRIFRFAYHTSLSAKSRRFRIHQLRDGDAFAELAPVFYSRAYEYGGVLLNLPAPKPVEPYPVDVSFLNSSDLIILNTRPPIDDITEEDKHLVPRSYTTFEEKVFNVLKPKYFETCARSHIKLSEALSSRLPGEFSDRANMLFHQSRDGSYIKHGNYDADCWRPPAHQRLTAVFFIHIAALWKDGPGLLAAFGMAGMETLAWNYLLRTTFLNPASADGEEWLNCYQFVMAELLPAPIPRRPTNLTFAEKWRVVPVLQVPLDT